MTANVWDIVRYFRHYRVMAFWSLLGAIAFELIISLAKDRKSKCCYQVNWLRIFAMNIPTISHGCNFQGFYGLCLVGYFR